MEQADKVIDTKVFDRIQKMLRLAKDGGATEGEAANAMNMAQQLMRDHNLTMAELEMSGKSGGEGAARAKSSTEGKAMYKYQQELMGTIARVNFVFATLKYEYKKGRAIKAGYTLVGREANVVSTIEMFKYLNSSIDRIVKPHLSSYKETLSRWAMSFKEGVSHRLQERLNDRHNEAMAEQSRKAREAQASRQSSASGNGSALVVVMEDYAQNERDANTDFRHNLEPGTTARRRAETDLRWAADEERRNKQNEADKAAEALRLAGLTEMQRKREEERRRKQEERSDRRWNRKHEQYWERKDVSAYLLGKKEAEGISLNQQVDQASRSRKAIS